MLKYRSLISVILLQMCFGWSLSAADADGRAWHLQWEHGNGVADLYLAERQGAIVAGFMRTTGEDAHWDADVAKLTVQPDGSLAGTVAVQRQPDVFARLNAAKNNPGRPWKEILPSALITLEARAQGAKVTGTVTVKSINVSKPTPVSGVVQAQTEVGTCQMEILPNRIPLRSRPHTGGDYLLLRLALKEGTVAEVAAMTLGHAHGPAEKHWKATCVPAQPVQDGRLQVVVSLAWAGETSSGEDQDAWFHEGKVTLTGTVIGDWLAGQASWEGSGQTLKTGFSGRITRMRQGLQMDYTPRSWTAPPLPEADPALSAQAITESLTPIRPEGPEGRSFWWNRLLARGKRNGFIYAPVLAFSPVPGAARYRFQIAPEPKWAREHRCTQTWKLESDQPWTSLAPVWKDLPTGAPLVISGMALTTEGGELKALETPEQSFGEGGWGGRNGEPWKPRVIPPAQYLRFIRKPSFQGPYGSESGEDVRRLVLSMARHQINTAQFVALRGLAANGVHDCSLGHIHFGESGSNLILASFIQSCCLIVQLTEDPVERQEVLTMAERIASVMAIQNRGRLPWTYHGFISNAFWVGWAWLDLYAVSKDERWRAAAFGLAQQLAKAQQTGGGWMGLKGNKADEKTDAWFGGVFGPSEFRECTPSSNLHFLGRIRRELGNQDFTANEARAWRGILTACVPTMTWQNIGWHSGEVVSPQDMVAPHALTFCIWLLDLAEDGQRDLKLAAQVARWCEDRHVAWDRQGDDSLAKPSCWGWGRAAGNANLIQARLAYVCARLGQETGDRLWLAKAQALVHGLITATDPASGANNADLRCTSGQGSWAFARMDYSETAARLLATVPLLAPGPAAAVKAIDK